jgi:sulfhydrogenase subunit gamma (sulfur reductase)
MPVSDRESRTAVLENNPLLPRTARVEERVRETEDTVSLRFSPLGSRPFAYRPGQFNMVGFPGFGEAPFSFSSLDGGDGTFTHTIRVAGNVVLALQSLERDARVSFRGPFGAGWPLEKARGRNLLLIAGGIGMAPLRPVVEYVLQNRHEFGEVFLLYGAKTAGDILFREHLLRWNRGLTVLLAADEPGDLDGLLLNVHKGLVTRLFEYVGVPLGEMITFTCGPQVMMKFAAARLLLDGQPGSDIHVSLERRMECGVTHCGHCQIGAKYVCKDGPVFALADINRFQDTLL